MATKKDTKKEKKYVAKNPYTFFTKNRSKKAIEMDYSMQAKPPSPEEHRINRSDWPGENSIYLKFFKKHNMPIPKKSSSSRTTTTKKTTKKSSGTKKKTTKKSSATKTTKKKTTSKKK